MTIVIKIKIYLFQIYLFEKKNKTNKQIGFGFLIKVKLGYGRLISDGAKETSYI